MNPLTYVREVKFLPPQEFKVNPDNGTFEGYCAFYGNVDEWGDRLLPGSGAATIKGNPTLPVYYGHGWMQNEKPVGKSLAFEDRPEGVFTRGKLYDTPAGLETLVNMREGTANGLSIGWKPDAGAIKMVKENDLLIREVAAWQMFEYSVTPMPANDLARVLDVKQRLAYVLAPVEVDTEGARAIRGEWEQTHRGPRRHLDVTGDEIEPKDWNALWAAVEGSDPLLLLLDEAAYLGELVEQIKAEGREEEVRRALGDLENARLLLEAKCLAATREEEPLDGLLDLVQRNILTIREAAAKIAS